MVVSSRHITQEFRSMVPVIERLVWPLPTLDPKKEIKKAFRELMKTVDRAGEEDVEFDIKPILKLETKYEYEELLLVDVEEETDIASENVFKSGLNATVEGDVLGEYWDDSIIEEDKSLDLNVIPNDAVEKDPFAECCDVTEVEEESVLGIKPEEEDPFGDIPDLLEIRMKKDISHQAHVRSWREEATIQKKQTKHKTRPECSYCHRVFANKSVLDDHIKRHTGIKPFPCSICSKSFPRKAYLKFHEATHSQVKPYVCHQCGKSYPTTRQLDYHRETHVKRPLRHVCQECNKKFYRKSFLLRHQLIHNEKKTNLTGPHSHRAFSRKRELKIHIGEHSKTNRFKCSLCEKEYHFRSSLNRHKMIHSKSMQFKCSHCKESFTRRDHLQSHILRVHLPKRFKCSFCIKSFSFYSKLELHEQLEHSKPKQDRCNSCKQSFSTPGDLKSHLVTEHPDTCCLVCNKAFCNKTYLRIHLLAHKINK